MSTTFAIFRIPVETDDKGQIISKYDEHDYLEIAHRSNSIYLYENIDKIKNCITKNTKVYPLDNTAQGIYTFGDILNKINNETN